MHSVQYSWVQEMHAVQEVYEVPEVHEVHEVHEEHDMYEVNEVNEVNEMHEVNEVHEVHEVNEVHEVHQGRMMRNSRPKGNIFSATILTIKKRSLLKTTCLPFFLNNDQRLGAILLNGDWAMFRKMQLS